MMIVKQLQMRNGESDTRPILLSTKEVCEKYLFDAAFDALALENPHWEVHHTEISVTVIDDECGFRLDYTMTEE